MEDRSDRNPDLMARLFEVYAPPGCESKVKKIFYGLVDQWHEWTDSIMSRITML
jgi:hypothetical protein